MSLESQKAKNITLSHLHSPGVIFELKNNG